MMPGEASQSTQEASVHRMRFGAQVERYSVRFGLYAPDTDHVRLALEGAEPQAMDAAGDGWFEIAVDAGQAPAGSRYRFLLPGGDLVPDPASRFQPEDVHGPSEVINPASFPWTDAAWRGRPWHEAILYELHVGTFTRQGTFPSALKRLDHLAELGITAIELMCVADFAGNRNWGYDGVLLFAPDSAYGRPEEMKRFIDAAHARGIMVILDVVYSHLGPEGNYLPQYFPQILTERHQTPWGEALNFDGEHSRVVRDFVVENALYWVEEFHLDGLRLDASHAMIDDSAKHILDELRERVRAAAGNRQIHLILENEQNISRELRRDDHGNPQAYTAQWNHDITHLLAAVFVDQCATADPSETEKLGQALAEGFVISAREHGVRDLCGRVPPTGFVAFIQTHDLVGNRIFGERLSSLLAPQPVRAIACILLLLPQIPMLFMGQEWAASTPFPFFCDYHGALGEAVRRGRCEQLSQLDPAPSAEEMERAPDPQADETLRSAQLRWEEIEEPGHAEWLDFYRRMIRVRSRALVPLLDGLADGCGAYKVIAPGALTACWTLVGGAELRLAANLCSRAQGGFAPAEGDVLWLEGSAQEGELGAWSVRWSLRDGTA